MRFKSIMKFGVTALLIGSSTSFAQTQDVICPSLTASDVQSVIDSGTISTDQGYSLADEAGMTRAQVLMNEPTANPFDTYYRMMGEKKINNHNYYIYVGNILGKADYEAKDRAKKILLSGENVFNAQYDSQKKLCMYTEIQASPSIHGYPFKSTYESVVLLAVQSPVQPDFMNNLVRRKYRS